MNYRAVSFSRWLVLAESLEAKRGTASVLISAGRSDRAIISASDPMESLTICPQYSGVILRSVALTNTLCQTKGHREFGEIRLL